MLLYPTNNDYLFFAGNILYLIYIYILFYDIYYYEYIDYIISRVTSYCTIAWFRCVYRYVDVLFIYSQSIYIYIKLKLMKISGNDDFGDKYLLKYNMKVKFFIFDVWYVEFYMKSTPLLANNIIFDFREINTMLYFKCVPLQKHTNYASNCISILIPLFYS